VGRTLPAVLGLAVLAAVALVALPQLSSGSLLPNLEDRNVLVRLQAAAGTSLTEMDRITGVAAAELRALPGVGSVGNHVGRAVGADEVVDVDAAEIWLTVDDGADYAETLAAVRSTVHGYPGLRSEVSTYADDRMAAVSDSTGDALVVRVSGQDYATLQETAGHVAQALRTVEGVISPEVEPLVSQPTVSVQVDLAAAQRFGLRPGDVRREVSAMVSGLTVGSLYEQQAIFDVVVWGGPPTRSSVSALESLMVNTPSGQAVRLGDVAALTVSPTPTVIAHDAVARSLDVTAVVSGRDAADVAIDATERLRQMTFPHEYRAEVLDDAVERAEDQRQVLLAAAAAAVLIFLLLQAATNSWRGATALFVAAPLAAAGALAAAALAGEARSVAVLTAVFAVVALTIRQSLVLVRRAQRLHTGSGSDADALRAAAREQAVPVLVAVLVTAALFLPAAVTGGAGLEILQPFAIAMLGGLITSTVVLLFLVPALLAATGGLRPPPVVGPDTPDGEPAEAGSVGAEHARHARPDNDVYARGAREGGAAMTTRRSYGIASLFVVVGLGLAGCQPQASGAEAESGTAPAVVETVENGGPARLSLIQEAVDRLRLETQPVAESPQGRTVPYSALVYDANGAEWVFVEVEERVYQRAPVTVATIVDNVVTLTDGPPVGTPVVTVAAAELVGVEAGISGGE
jgi:Cu/Ag efflux pump CusA